MGAYKTIFLPARDLQLFRHLAAASWSPWNSTSQRGEPKRSTGPSYSFDGHEGALELGARGDQEESQRATLAQSTLLAQAGEVAAQVGASWPVDLMPWPCQVCR